MMESVSQRYVELGDRGLPKSMRKLKLELEMNVLLIGGDLILDLETGGYESLYKTNGGKLPRKKRTLTR